MYNLICNWSTEEKLLIQAILSKYNMSVMSIDLVNFWWKIRAMSPDHANVRALQSWVGALMDLQVKIGVDLKSAGIPDDIVLNAPISKSVFQSLSQEKKDIVHDLMFERFGGLLGELKFFGIKVMMNIWNNELIR
jgi:hypothetical protein